MTNMVPSAEERMRGLCVDWSADIADQATIVRGDVTAALARAYADGLASKEEAVREAVEREQAKTRVFLVERAALYTPGEEGRHYYGLIIGQLDRRARGEGR